MPTAACRVLYVTDANPLDDTLEAAADRELLRGLVGLGLDCRAVGRFVLAADPDRDPRDWLVGHGYKPAAAGADTVRADARGVAVTLYRGPSARLHAPTAEETTAFLRLLDAALDADRPDVLLARPGHFAAAALTAARGRRVAAAVLQADAAPKEPDALRSADVVLAPTAFTARHLRDAYGLPAAWLPPVAAGGPGPSSGAVVFDGTAPGGGLPVFAQLADAISRRRPDVPFVILGGNGAVPLASGGTVRGVSRYTASTLWPDARVLVAPAVGWAAVPAAVPAALAHGVAVLASDRGPLPELVGGAGELLPLPDRLTPAHPARLTAAELAPWVDAVLRRYDDPAPRPADRRFAADALAPRYAEFLAGLAARRRPSAAPAPEAAADPAVRRLADDHPWPAERPADAAPGQEQGWLGEGSDRMLAAAVPPDARLVVELGAWLGLSSRFIADARPRATVVSIDHWVGGPEHAADPRFAALLPRLMETFQARCWGHRGRIVPVRAKTLDGLRRVAAAGAEPDFVYVDAEHSREAVAAELELIRELFPAALVGGDDYDWCGVRSAVDAFADRHGQVVDRVGRRGWRLLPGWRAADAGPVPPARGQWAVLVPHLNGIEWECEQALRQLEAAGVRVVRRGGCSAVDVARNELLSDALHDGAERMLFIDADIGFDPADVLRLFARPEPAVSAVYPKKGPREMASTFLDGVNEVRFGPDAPGAYPLKYAATGFLRVTADLLRRLIAGLRLPLCNTHWGRGVWPFFQPMVVPHGDGRFHYLGEDWAFSRRLQEAGVVPLADTSVRLWHWGRYGFGWEDAGRSVDRYRSYSYRLADV